jgi:hypothetical protein
MSNYKMPKLTSNPESSLTQLASGRGLSTTVGSGDAVDESGTSPALSVAIFPDISAFAATRTAFSFENVDSSSSPSDSGCLSSTSPSSSLNIISTGTTFPVDDGQASRSVSPLLLESDDSCHQLHQPFTQALADIKNKMAEIIDDIKLTREETFTSENARSILMYCRDAILQLDENHSEFLAESDSSERYYIRPCYRDVYSIMDDTFQGIKPRRFEGYNRTSCAMITGTPGIGKSVFGLILAKLLMKRAKPVLIFFESHSVEGIQTFWQGRVGFLTIKAALEMISAMFAQRLVSTISHDKDDVEIWSIADTCLPLKHQFINRVCITSPGHAANDATHMKTWIKDNKALVLTLPPCEWYEILQIRDANFGDIADNECPLGALRERYDMWGGVPRTIMDEAAKVREYEIAFRELKIADALEYLGTSKLNHPRHSGRVFHLLPSFMPQNDPSEDTLREKYANGRGYWWASETMERKAWAQFRHQEELKVIDFIQALDNHSVSRGRAWETQIHHLISVSGIKGPLRNLQTGKVTEDFSICQSTSSYFSFLEDIDSSSQYWRPVSSTHKLSDGYIPGSGVLVQMTVGVDHEINIAGIEEVLEARVFGEWEDKHPDEKLRLIFIVHPSVFDHFQKQTYRYPNKEVEGTKIRSTDKRRKTRKDQVEDRVEQYVMTVDLKERLEQLRASFPKCTAEEDLDSISGRAAKRQKKF